MPAIDPITIPVTMLVTNAAPLRAVTDALTDLATAIRNMLDDQAEPEPGGFLDGLISVSEAAARLGVSEGKLPSGRHGGRVLIPSDAVAERIERKSADVPAGPAPTVEPKPDAPIDLDGLGLGAVVRATVGAHRCLWVKTPDDGLSWVSDVSDDNVDAWWCASAELTDVEVLHPGITIGGEDE